MSIYTRTGDTGQTSLFGGKRVLKSDLQIESYGSLDELTSFFGLIIFYEKNPEERVFLTEIQKDLYLIMGFLAGAPIKLTKIKNRVPQFESEIDKITAQLPQQKHFIIPQGTLQSVWLHINRTVCRRTERIIIRYLHQNFKEQKTYFSIISYLNRLSDYLYIKARMLNKKHEKTLYYEKT